MTGSELIATGIYSGMAFILGVLVIAGLGILLQTDRYIGRWVAFIVVPAMGLGTALSSALSGRDLKYAYNNIEAIAATGAAGGTNLLRLITAAVVGISAATVIATLFRRSRRPDRPIPAPGQPLFASFVAFFLCNAIFNAAFGTVPAFVHNVIYLPVVFGAVYIWRQEPLDSFVRMAKWMLMAFMLGSLALALAKPALAVQTAYKGWVPGLSIRLWGLGSNPNSIGPLALLLLLLEWMQPSRLLWSRALSWGLGLTVLLLAQSKTAWVAGFAMVSVVTWYRVGRAPGGGMRIGFALALIAGLLVLAAGLAFVDLGRIWDRIAATRVGSDVGTLSGRTQIWVAAIEAWWQNPVFGYGVLAWGPEHRAALGMPFAFSAHNQFLQSMSMAGTLGLVSLLVYLGVLGVCCLWAVEVTRGASVALFLFVLLRCLTEAPLTPGTLYNGDAITHLLLFRIALLGARCRPQRGEALTAWRTGAVAG